MCVCELRTRSFFVVVAAAAAASFTSFLLIADGKARYTLWMVVDSCAQPIVSIKNNILTELMHLHMVPKCGTPVAVR